MVEKVLHRIKGDFELSRKATYVSHTVQELTGFLPTIENPSFKARMQNGGVYKWCIDDVL